MRGNAVAAVRFSGPVGRRPKGRFLAQAKLPGDAPDSPFGQWDLVVEPVYEFDGEQHAEIVAFVDFLSPEAPGAALRGGVEIELFHGTTPVGKALVLESRGAGLDKMTPTDTDFLAGREPLPTIVSER